MSTLHLWQSAPPPCGHPCGLLDVLWYALGFTLICAAAVAVFAGLGSKTC